jgi:transcriptional regulator with GAF, ATPase, and Fis domain
MEVERRKIQQALDEAQWDQTRAASALQIPPRVLLARIRDFKLAPR